MNSKDLAIAELRIKNDEQINKLNSKLEQFKSQNEQFKIEIELNKKNEMNLMQKYQEQVNAAAAYLKDNEALKNSYQNLQNSYDSFKVQSKNYENLVDDSNNQVRFIHSHYSSL